MKPPAMEKSEEELLRRGIAHQDAGRPDLAHALYQQVLRHNPANADAWHLDGIIAFRAGNLGAAEKMITHAIKQNPQAFLFHVTLGNVLRAQGRHLCALDAYNTALERDVDAASAYFNRATLFQDMERHEEALADLDAILRLVPKEKSSPDLARLRAVSLITLGRKTEGMRLYEEALQRHPDDIGCRLGLAENLEAQAQIDEAFTHVRHVLQRFPQHWRAATLAAVLERRKGDPAAAVRQLQSIDTSKLPFAAARRVHSERALAHDRLGESDAAMREFAAQNLIAQKECAASPLDKNRYLQTVQKLREHMEGDAPRAWRKLPRPAPWGEHPPVFLIGFPRSGTTLLDQILDAHPDIHVLEERPMLAVLRDRLQELPGGYPAALGTMDAKMRDGLRALYRSQLQQSGAPENRLIINKLPLNLIHTGLIHRVFPEARLILALRHPCDVVLSCFMQDFALNNAMANFFTLEDSARLYDEVLSLWNVFRARLDVQVHEIRYEDVLAAFDAEVARLLGFLSLPWNDAVRDFAAHARGRFIRTPSYEQVTGALHDRSSGRWRRYRQWLEPHIVTFSSHIAALGYDGEHGQKTPAH